MYKIGITGGIGSGKSIVCSIFEKMGYPVYYSDFEAKRILTQDKAVRNQVVSFFGNEAYVGDELNRKWIADQIFNDESKKIKLNSIIHPVVRTNFENWADLQNSKIVLNEAAILFETGSYRNFDKTILVTAPEEIKIGRVVKRDKCSVEEVKQRMKNQWSDEKKIPLANFIIENDDCQSLLKQIDQILSQL